MEKDELKELKKDYRKIQQRYNLPDFIDLNKDFQIEKIAETETDFLIREVRKYLADKFSNYLRFIEAIINPVNAPMFVFSLIKSTTDEEKKELRDIYKKLAKIQIDVIELDIEFDEDKESEFIKKSYKIWGEIKKTVLKIIDNSRKNWDNKVPTNGKGYFG
jgi:hypothetical protein